jgi:hypothetical protein
VANCFARDQSSAFVESSLGDCCCLSEYVKRMETTRRRYQAYRLRISCVSKANTSKGWKRLDGGIKRIGCVSAAYPRCVVEAHDRQTDFRFNYDRRLSSFQAPIEPTMAPVASPVVAGLKRRWKGTGNKWKQS